MSSPFHWTHQHWQHTLRLQIHPTIEPLYVPAKLTGCFHTHMPPWLGRYHLNLHHILKYCLNERRTVVPRSPTRKSLRFHLNRFDEFAVLRLIQLPTMNVGIFVDGPCVSSKIISHVRPPNYIAQSSVDNVVVEVGPKSPRVDCWLSVRLSCCYAHQSGVALIAPQLLALASLGELAVDA